MDRFEVMFDSEIEDIKLRTRIETAKQIFKEIEKTVLDKEEQLFSEEDYQKIKDKFLQGEANNK